MFSYFSKSPLTCLGNDEITDAIIRPFEPGKRVSTPEEWTSVHAGVELKVKVRLAKTIRTVKNLDSNVELIFPPSYDKNSSPILGESPCDHVANCFDTTRLDFVSDKLRKPRKEDVPVPPPVTITFLPSTPNKALAFSEESKPDISIKCWDGKSDSSADRDPSEGEIKWFSNRDPYDFVHEFLVVQGSLRR